MQTLIIETEFVPLFVALQLVDWVDSGGRAKHLIAEGEVCVNGQIETQKRKKLRPGDKFSFSGQECQIQSSE